MREEAALPSSLQTVIRSVSAQRDAGQSISLVELLHKRMAVALRQADSSEAGDARKYPSIELIECGPPHKVNISES